MKKILPSPFPAFVLAAMLFSVAAAYGLDEPGEIPLETSEVNGIVWLESDQESKLNFLLGVENSIAMEYAIADAMAEKSSTVPYYSPFQKGWRQAFDNTPRSVLARRIDDYYQRHPKEQNRHVFDIIWNEMILPATTEREGGAA